VERNSLSPYRGAERKEASDSGVEAQAEMKSTRKGGKKEAAQDKIEKSARKEGKDSSKGKGEGRERDKGGGGKQPEGKGEGKERDKGGGGKQPDNSFTGAPPKGAISNIEAQASIALSRDGKGVLVSWLNKVEVMSPVSRKRILSLEGHTAPVTAVCVHPVNVSQAYTASFDGTIRLWDIQDGANIKQWNLHMAIYQLVISPDGKYAYATLLKAATQGNKGASYVHQINLESNEQQRLFKCREPAKVSMSGDGQMLFAVARRLLYVFFTSHSRHADGGKDSVDGGKDSVKGQQQRTKLLAPIQLEHTRDLVAVGCHPDGAFVATADVRGEIFMWYNVKESSRPPDGGGRGGAPVCSQSSMHWHAQAVSCLNCTQDGAYLMSAGQEGVLVLWQVDTGFRQFLPRLGGPVLALANSACGTVVAVLCQDQVIQLINLLTRKVSRTLRLMPVPPSASAPGDRSGGAGKGGPLMSAARAGAILGVEPRLGHLLINSRSGALHIFDAQKGKHVCSVEVQVRNVVSSATVSGDKKAPVSPAGDCTVLLASMSSDGDNLVVVLGPRRWGAGGDGRDVPEAAAHISGGGGGGDNVQLSFFSRTPKARGGADSVAPYQARTKVMFPHGMCC
jgi:WD40 repeat protein